MLIYVLDMQGRPLMPTRRAGKVRNMLADGRAAITGHTPFTIRLTYETTHFTQPVTLGVDPGSKVAGLSAATEKQELLSMELNLRTDIVSNIALRREARRTRRSKRSIRYRAPRFSNRLRRQGWLPPSIRQKAEAHLRTVGRITSILPVTSIVVETAQFDMQKIKNPDISGEQYRHGEQERWKNVREYVLWRDGHKCRHCGGKSKDPILQVHHLESRKNGGNSPDNLVTLCKTCHDAYHVGKTQLKLKRLSPSLRDATAVNVYRWRIYEMLKEEYGGCVRLVYGYTTKDRRISLGLHKSSEADAFCIAGNLTARRSEDIMTLKCLRRHNRKAMKSNMLKGGRWKRNQAEREIKGFRRYDVIRYGDIIAYIHGRRTTGSFSIKDFKGQTLSEALSYKKLTFVRHNNNYMYNIKKRLAVIPPTNKSVGFLTALS